MALPLEVLRALQQPDPAAAWAAACAHAWEVCAAPLDPATARTEVGRRDDALAPLDLYLATAGWDLWNTLGSSVQRTSDALAAWWDAQLGGRAVLVLDGLSLRELPWLLQGAEARGYAVHQARATASELPADTTPFARALGVGQRSAISNDGVKGGKHRLPGARTESENVPWADAAATVKGEPRWLFWHHWPDVKIHEYAAAGSNVGALAAEAAQQLRSDDFWRLVERLATGRRLVITGDHGYAASGAFPDVGDDAQARWLKDTFKAQRFAAGDTATPSGAVPPMELRLATPHGAHTFVLGRRKWKVAGGYPVLSHGGLSIMEVAVPFIELSLPD